MNPDADDGGGRRCCVFIETSGLVFTGNDEVNIPGAVEMTLVGLLINSSASPDLVLSALKGGCERGSRPLLPIRVRSQR